MIQKNQEIDSLFKLGADLLKEGKPSEATSIFEECILAYEQEGNNKKAGDSYAKLATGQFYLGKYDKALLNFEKVISLYDEVKYLEGVSKAKNNLGAVYYFLGKNGKALKYYQSALKDQQVIQDEGLIASLNYNIGIIYLELDDFENALDYMNHAIDVYRKTSNKGKMANAYNGLGSTYSEKKDFAKALEFYNNSLNIANEIDNKQTKLQSIFNIGQLFQKQEKYVESQKYLKDAVALSRKIKNKRFESASLIALGEIDLVNLNSSRSIDNCIQGLAIAKKIEAIDIERDACDCLYQAYKETRSLGRALAYYEQSNALTDSLKTEETANKVLNMEFEKQMLRDSLEYVESENQLKIAHLQEVSRKEKQRNILLASAGFIVFIAFGLWSRLRFVRKSKTILQKEKDRSEALLLNILPQEIADELKENGRVQARDFELASILFTDFESFTHTSSMLQPQELVEEINACFKQFDLITDQYGLEKIKTIGDAYMAAGGLPQPDKANIKQVVLAAIEMQDFIQKRKQHNEQLGKPAFAMRLGIHAGPLVAGIVGVKKFQYDVWGDTVNTASRLESNGAVGKVNISETIYQKLKDEQAFHFTYRGLIQVKGKADMKMYFVEKRKQQISLPSHSVKPVEAIF